MSFYGPGERLSIWTVLPAVKKTVLPRVKLLSPATSIPRREAFAVAYIKPYRKNCLLLIRGLWHSATK